MVVSHGLVRDTKAAKFTLGHSVQDPFQNFHEIIFAVRRRERFQKFHEIFLHRALLLLQQKTEQKSTIAMQ